MEANQEAQSAKADVRMALDTLAALRREGDRIKAQYRMTVQGARHLGISVADIAAALGISRTAVYKQLGKR